jgi:hypothetical protein
MVVTSRMVVHSTVDELGGTDGTTIGGFFSYIVGVNAEREREMLIVSDAVVDYLDGFFGARHVWLDCERVVYFFVFFTGLQQSCWVADVTCFSGRI